VVPKVSVTAPLGAVRNLLQPSSKEDHNTFRTTPQEHWWIWPECPRHAQVNNYET